MPPTGSAPPTHLGFLTVVHEPDGYVGGYLVTNFWGRPVEFRVSTAVQPNRVQQILYGGTLQPYVCADLIGRTLVEKTTTPVAAVVTDQEPVLELREAISTPVVWLASPDDALAPALAEAGAEVPLSSGSDDRLFCHPRFPADVAAVRSLLVQCEAAADLREALARVREAIAEARKLGVTARG